MALGVCLNFEYALALQKHTGKKKVLLCVPLRTLW